ncbi:MAG: NTP transferase domain-containing protein [Bacteroidaceae bacterium]|nr:NTP transferase domain-containing protein [Bacteroidaceae bacterium]
MKAMIFAAGLGTRLKPLTDTLPKALVPVCEKPLIEHVARKLHASGIDEAVVNIHYFADKVEEWVAAQDWIVASRDELVEGKMLFEISDERELLLETGGAVLHARRFLEGCGKFLIHNVDILSNCDIQWFESQVKDDAMATLLVSERPTTRFLLFNPETLRLVGWMNTDSGDYHVTSPEINPKECRALAFSGIHILSDKVLALMQEYVVEKGLPINEVNGTRFPIMSFYMWLASKYPVYGVVAKNLEFIDVGKLDALKPAEEFVRGNQTT